MSTAFPGFPKGAVAFLEQLENNNDREWFVDHRSEYETRLLDPARAFVVAMGARLERIAPQIHALPQVDKSIFRMHRDVRFSKDKRPFKTHLGIYFWEGDRPKMECPGFYFHLEKDRLLIGGGMHIIPKPLIDVYREAVDDNRLGAELERILAEGRRRFPGGLEDDKMKRVPRGYPADHPRGELLMHRGITLGEFGPIPDTVFTAEGIDYVFERFEKMVALHRWLLKLHARAEDI